jgi:hypothetical protein
MPEMVRITDDNYLSFLDGPDDRPRRQKGHIRRNHATHPVGCYAAAPMLDIPVMSDDEIQKGIRRQEETQSSLEHIRMRGDHGQPIPALDQNGQGFCWAYSTTGAVQMLRARNNQPYVPLSGHMIGCLVKGYRDQGGWNGESLDFAKQNGIASQKLWKPQSMSQSNDTPEMRHDALRRRVTEFRELSHAADERKRQLATLLLQNFGVMGDFNWWSHSVCILRLLAWNPFKILILNSWSNSWSRLGMGEIEGSKALPDDCACPLVSVGD